MLLSQGHYLTFLVSHLQRVINHLPSAVYVCEAPSGVISLYNQRAVEFWGREPKLGDTDERFCGAFRLFHPDGRPLPHAETPMAEALRGGSVHDEEVIIERPDGSRLPVRVNIGPLRDPEGHIVGAINVFQDISGTKQAEAAVRRAAEAEAANRGKDEFLAILAHELRNPLSIVVNASAVLGATRLEPQAERARAAIARNTQHLSRMLDDLLDVARVSPGRVELKRERIDLRAVAEQAVEAQRQQFDTKELRLVTALPDEPVVVVGDAVRLHQVLTNLLNNSAKYTPAGGTIWLGLEEDTGAAILRVRDDGCGVPPEKLGAIFDLFMQVDPRPAHTEGGLGIGLTLVKRLVELHGGTIHALSDGLGRGAEFVVRIPAASPVADTAGPVMSPSTAMARRVLVIEDDDDGRAMLVTMLELYGHEVYEAATGREGVEEAARRTPDVVLIDIGLPDTDGYDVGRRLRERLGPSVRLVALTGYGQPGDRERSALAGFDTHLVKPVEPATLSEIFQAG
jgi:signal transduction histidine kinase